MLFLITSLLLAVSWWWPLALWAALLWLLVLTALLIADWQVSPKPRQWTVARSHDNRLSLAAPNRITLHVGLRQALRPVRIWVRDTPPANFAMAAGERILSGMVAPGKPAEYAYDVIPPRRGDYTFADLYLRWESVLGLLRRQTRIQASAPVKVYPNLVDVRKYDLMLRRNRLWELGLRSVRTLGGGAEFERLPRLHARRRISPHLVEGHGPPRQADQHGVRKRAQPEHLLLARYRPHDAQPRG